MAPQVGNMSREREIVDLVGLQKGVITHAQLIALGVGPRTIKRWVGAGRLRSVHRELYAFGPLALTRHGKWLAAVLAMGPNAFLSHQSAAALWGLRGDRPKVDVTAPRGKQVRPGRKGIQVHRCQFDPVEVTVRSGISVSTVARTLFDLAERSRPYELKDAWDEADRLKLLRVPEVVAVYERGRGRRARTQIRPLLLAEQRYLEDTASPLEDRFAEFVIARRLPPPQFNVLVGEDVVDALWPAARLIVELDSWEFHGHRAAFEEDRDRDTDHLLAGYRTIRVTHRKLSEQPDRLAAQIRTLLAT
ncbi:MAG: type IV toxin-antitoxin system AbiEi family antitoxin domain-containing protein [Actinobacteria bacterium]|nr:type IV toxin-antitoxin system AbiEi family antitoxin domain-containing protein [Actinomycetota bacterium]